jgi:hypothetical protein
VLRDQLIAAGITAALCASGGVFERVDYTAPQSYRDIPLLENITPDVIVADYESAMRMAGKSLSYVLRLVIVTHNEHWDPARRFHLHRANTRQSHSREIRRPYAHDDAKLHKSTFKIR